MGGNNLINVVVTDTNTSSTQAIPARPIYRIFPNVDPSDSTHFFVQNYNAIANLAVDFTDAKSGITVNSVIAPNTVRNFVWKGDTLVGVVPNPANVVFSYGTSNVPVTI